MANRMKAKCHVTAPASSLWSAPPAAGAEGLPGGAWESWVAWPVACVLAASRARNLSCFCFLVWFSVGLSRIHSQALGGLAGSEPGGDLKCRLLRGQGGEAGGKWARRGGSGVRPGTLGGAWGQRWSWRRVRAGCERRRSRGPVVTGHFLLLIPVRGRGGGGVDSRLLFTQCCLPGSGLEMAEKVCSLSSQRLGRLFFFFSLPGSHGSPFLQFPFPSVVS